MGETIFAIDIWEGILAVVLLLGGIVWVVILLNMMISKQSKIKNHIPKIMIIFSMIFFVIGIFNFINRIQSGRGLSGFNHENIVPLVLLFALSGLFLALYRIIDLLEKR
jgi:amino acid transporter